MIVFGGFFEAVRETPRWYNDLHVYDFSTNSWIECKYSTLASLPPERSAFNFGMFTGTDVAFVSGGFAKLKNPAPGTKAEGLTYTDCWALHLKNLEGGKVPTWERLSKKGEYPSQRSGTSCTVWKNKLLVFGGVQDEEVENHRVRSVFYDDLFALDMERRRWFRLNLKKKSTASRRKKKGKKDDTLRNEDPKKEPDKYDSDDDSDETNEVDGEAMSSGWDLDKLRANMFAFIDADGKIVYEKIEADEDDDNDQKHKAALPGVAEVIESDTGYEADTGGTNDEQTARKSNQKDSTNISDALKQLTFDEENNETTILDKVETSLSTKLGVPLIEESEVMKVNKDGIPEAVTREVPLPRISAQILIRGNTLIIYGGIIEVGEREVTLDDCWSIDIQKREQWNCIWKGSMHKQVWKGAESDNESYISTDAGTGGMDSDADDDSDFAEFDEEFDDNFENEALKVAAKAARKEEKKRVKKEKIKGIREEIQKINEKLGLDDRDRTPQTNEDLAAFYTRTSSYWEQEAVKQVVANQDGEKEEQSAKELKRAGFNLAKDRFEQVQPALQRLDELENTHTERESHPKEKKSSKKKKKKDGKK